MKIDEKTRNDLTRIQGKVGSLISLSQIIEEMRETAKKLDQIEELRRKLRDED